MTTPSATTDPLLDVPFLRQIPLVELKRYGDLWVRVALRPGENMWTEGGLAAELGVVISGELAVVTGGVEVGRVRSGELAGEASAFFRGETRTASLRAETPAEVLTLSVRDLIRLRREGSVIYDALLRQALVTLVRRIRATDLRIAQLAQGGRAAPSRAESGLLSRVWRALRPDNPTGPAPSLEPLLRKMPVLRPADPEEIIELSRLFTAEPMKEGQVIFMEGAPGEAAYIVAEGKVEVLRHVRGERAELLATLERGDLFGANTLVESGARTASCIAAEPGWLYRIDAKDFNAPSARAGLLWREAVLAALASQLRLANLALNRAIELKASLHGDHSDATASADNEASFRELLRASGFLQGSRTSDAHLGVMDSKASGGVSSSPYTKKRE